MLQYVLRFLQAGIALCVVGYYAGGAMSAVDLFRDYKSDQVDFTNNDTWSRNVTISYLHNLTYVGPMLMGCGCFSTVIACVVVCETRDKQLKVPVCVIQLLVLLAICVPSCRTLS